MCDRYLYRKTTNKYCPSSGLWLRYKPCAARHRLINTLNGALRAPYRPSQLRCSSLHSNFLYAMKIFDNSLSVPGKAPQEQNVYIQDSNSAARKPSEYSPTVPSMPFAKVLHEDVKLGKFSSYFDLKKIQSKSQHTFSKTASILLQEVSSPHHQAKSCLETVLYET